jgi:two-component system OmpR family response regulator
MGRTALVVEDDRLLSEMLVDILQKMDFDATPMLDGTDAAGWVKNHRPDVVLLDLMLPGRSGYEVCEELKLDRDTNLIPIVICSARSQHEDKMRGLRIGANFYLTKPFTVEQLEHAVDHALAWRREVEQAGTAGEVHFELKSEAHHLEELNRLLSSLFLHTGMSEDDAFRLTTAVREMGTNAIEWGNKKRADSAVTVTYRIDAEKIVIVIRDEGSGFDRANLPHAVKCMEDPASHLEVRDAMGLRIGGFGIFMSRGMVDELQYNDAGNEVRLVKRFVRT